MIFDVFNKTIFLEYGSTKKDSEYLGFEIDRNMSVDAYYRDATGNTEEKIIRLDEINGWVSRF